MRKIAGGIIIIIAVVGAITWMLWNEEGKSPTGATEATFQCVDGKYLDAEFKQKSVIVTLSDDRSMQLEQVQSASGIRYTNQDETVVFWNKGNTAVLIEEGKETYTDCVEEGKINNNDLKTYKNDQNVFAVRYPSVFEIEQSQTDKSTAWSYNTATVGTVGLKLLIPASYQPKTNFQEAAFLVGWSEERQAVEQCLEPPEANIMKEEQVTTNGVTYHHTRYGEAGAGNFYEIDRYRTVRKERCYSIEQMIHSTNLGNYSPDQDITAFNKKKVQKTLEQAWQGFVFL
jgi:membrane-bound inhibitor of C-type lysozyme